MSGRSHVHPRTFCSAPAILLDCTDAVTLTELCFFVCVLTTFACILLSLLVCRFGSVIIIINNNNGNKHYSSYDKRQFL